MRKRLSSVTMFLAAISMTLGIGAGGRGVSAANEEVSSPSIVNGVITWNCVEFGHYLQSDTNKDGTVDENDEKQPIKWRVLSASEDDMFLLSDKILEIKSYDEEVSNRNNPNETASNPDKNVTWENSTIRKWLNETFYDTAFNDEEKDAVKTTTVKNITNNVAGTPDAEQSYETEDNVYLLSQDEAKNSEYGFDTNNTQSATRKAAATSYATKGIYVINNNVYREWLLRDCISYGNSDSNVNFVRDNGTANISTSVKYATYGVRPVIHIKSSSLWTKTEDITVTKYKVRYDANGGDSLALPVSSEIAYGDMFYVDYSSIPTRSGYDFLGWATDSSATERVDALFEYNKNEDTTLYAIWGASRQHGLNRPRYSKDPEKTWQDIVTWDCVYFGNYYQSGTSEKEPIKWRVLSVNGDDAFLMADKALDCREYKGENWESSEIRKWLNDNFYNFAFNADEQKAIIETKVVNNDNYYSGTKGGNNTVDRLYLLSLGEVNDYMYGFGQASEYNYSLSSRKSLATSYAESQGINYNAFTEEDKDKCDWMLRSASTGNTGTYAASYGGVSYYGYSGKLAIRPVLHINLASSVWYSCGTVDSNGKAVGDVKPVKATPTPVATQQAPEVTQAPVTTAQQSNNTSDNATTKTAKKLKLSSVKCKKNTKKITGKVSVKGAKVKIKVGKSAFSKAKVKGKNFVLTLKKKLNKKDKIKIVVTKKNYETLTKSYKVK